MTRVARARQLIAAMRAHRSRRALEFGSREDLLRFQRARFGRRSATPSPPRRCTGSSTRAATRPTCRRSPRSCSTERFADWVTDPRLRLGDLERHVERLGGDDALFAGEFRVMSTGGTSGRRTIHAFDQAEWTECLVAFMRWSELFGLRPKLPRIRIATVMTVGARHMTSRFNLSTDVGAHRTLRLDAGGPRAS